jgi:hypothetical protein
MSNMFINPLSQEDLSYDGFFDGQNKTIPEGTELEFIVTDGFVGIEEGKSIQVCIINLSITTPGEFFGQKYRYNAKIYDMDANKRDLAMRNLGVLDAQAGFPMTNGKLALITENIQDYWANVAQARVKFGLLISEDDGREINFVRGFAYLRDKMIRPGEEAPSAQVAQPEKTQQAEYSDPDIDF